jgi:hypothetical protein
MAFTVDCTHRPGGVYTDDDGVEIVYSILQQSCPPTRTLNKPTSIVIPVILLVIALYVKYGARRRCEQGGATADARQQREQELVVSTSMTPYKPTNKDGILKIG